MCTGIVIHGCAKYKSKDTILIKGDIKGLPDGDIFLIDVDQLNKKIDSGKIANGKFQIITSKNNRFLTVNLMAKDNSDTIRLFAYPTNKLHNGKPNAFGYFILEDNVHVYGKLIDFNFKAPGKMKLVNLNQAVTGKQSWVLYNITLDFPASSAEFVKFREKIKSYSYSYYLLSEIRDNISLLDDVQLKESLQLFDSDIKQTPLWNRLALLSEEIEKYDSKPFKFVNVHGDSIPMLNPGKNSLNIIILWASWCGPCLKEIPALKKAYEINKDNKNLNIVSISVDKSFEDWSKAVNKYQMSWTQLISADPEETRKLFFRYKTPSVLPTILILDNKGNLLDKIMSYNSEEDLIEKLGLTIAQHSK